jgi:hypothetical protein
LPQVRQRYRARRQAQQPQAAIRRSRAHCWRDAVAELLALQGEYAAWSDALPESLRNSATAEALQEIIDLDLDSLANIRPSRGLGRDQTRMKWGISARRFWGISPPLTMPSGLAHFRRYMGLPYC